MFATFLLIILPVLGITFGWFHLKKSGFFPAEQDIMLEANPYATKIIQKESIPLYEAIFKLLEVHDIHDESTEKMKEIIKNSKKRWGV